MTSSHPTTGTAHDPTDKPTTPQFDLDSKIGIWGPTQVEETEATSQYAPKKRTPWGGLYVLWGLLAILGAQLITLPVLLFIAFSQTEVDLASPDAVDVLTQEVTDLVTTGPGLVIALVSQWVVFVGVPVVATYRKGHRSLAKDFGLVFKLSDLWIGLGFALVLQVILFGFSAGMNATGIDLSGADNTGMVTEQTGALLILMIIAASIMAPLTEEIFFRGMVLRAFLRSFAKIDHAPPLPGVTDTRFNLESTSARRRRIGTVAAVLGSSLFFGILHVPISDGTTEVTLAAQMMLVFQTGFLGLVFAIVALRTRRIGLTIATHLWFNSASITLVFLTT